MINFDSKFYLDEEASLIFDGFIFNDSQFIIQTASLSRGINGV